MWEYIRFSGDSSPTEEHLMKNTRSSRTTAGAGMTQECTELPGAQILHDPPSPGGGIGLQDQKKIYNEMFMGTMK